MAAAIGCWVRDTAIIENQKAVEYKKAFLGAVMTNKTHLETRIPGQYTPSTQDRAFDHHKKFDPFSWITKG